MYNSFSNDIKSNISSKMTTDWAVENNKFSDIITHSNKHINKNTEKYSSEIISDSSFNTLKQSDSTIKTSEINENSQNIFNTNENTNPIITESNSIESETKLASNSESIKKSEYDSEITSSSIKYLEHKRIFNIQ